MKKTRVLPLLLAFCLGLTALAGCGWVDRTRNDLNPLYFLDGALYGMEIGPSELTIDTEGEVEDARIYLLAKGVETTSHYEVTFHKGDDAAVATDLKDAPFQGTHSGYLMELRRALMHLIDKFSGKAMEIKYVPQGYHLNLSQYAGIYYQAYNGNSFTKVDPDTILWYHNYLEVTVGEEVYFVALGTNELE